MSSSMWMWLLVKISIYHILITSEKTQFFLDEKFQISDIVSKHGSNYVKWYGSTCFQLS